MSNLANKVHKKRRQEEALRKAREEAIIDSFELFMAIGSDYLYENFHCKQKGIEKFMRYVDDEMSKAKESSQYLANKKRKLREKANAEISFVYGEE